MNICLLSVLCVVQAQDTAIGRSLVQGRPTECVCVSLRVIKCNNHPLYTYSEWVEEAWQKQFRCNIQWNKTVCKAYKQNELNFHQTNKKKTSEIRAPKIAAYLKVKLCALTYVP
jgi:hypothetical protein